MKSVHAQEGSYVNEKSSQGLFHGGSTNENWLMSRSILVIVSIKQERQRNKKQNNAISFEDACVVLVGSAHPTVVGLAW